ncbi:MAG: hypothetical protein R3A45_08110 [Bdellovibrionota bacterium]
MSKTRSDGGLRSCCQYATFFTSTALMPSKQMPDWLMYSNLIPLSICVEAFRGAILLGQTPTWITQLIPLLLLSLVLFIFGFVSMQKAAQTSIWETR